MKLLLPAEIRHRLEHELRRARTAEIGGVLMGEHIGPDRFRILDLTVDRGGGSFARFVRAMGKHRFGLDAFFRRTGKQFTKFNYLGEWHSHPSFQLTPSGTDLSTMRSIVDDSTVGALFAVLMIVRLSADGSFEARVTLFRPVCADIHPVDLVVAADA